MDAGGTRQALYGPLPPGSSHFKVIGSGSEGVWNDEGASYAFEIVPLFYNTWWFRTMALLSVAFIVVATHRLRVRRLTNRMQLQFEARLAERTRIAQELHDTLLQGTLAASLHAQLAEQALQAAPPSPALENVRSPLKQAMVLLSDVARESRAVLGGLRSRICQHRHRPGAAPGRWRTAESRRHRISRRGGWHPAAAEAARGRGCDADRREAVVNAYQHAGARLVEVELVYAPDSFQCIVRDDGCGIEERVLERGRDGHWGLAGMRERAERSGGELHLRSSVAAGTEVTTSL